MTKGCDFQFKIIKITKSNFDYAGRFIKKIGVKFIKGSFRFLGLFCSFISCLEISMFFLNQMLKGQTSNSGWSDMLISLIPLFSFCSLTKKVFIETFGLIFSWPCSCHGFNSNDQSFRKSGKKRISEDPKWINPKLKTKKMF